MELKTQKLTLTNSQAKTVTLSLGIVKGNGHISVPVYFSRNDGFNKIKLGISYNKNILAFQSVTLAPEVQSTLTQSDYNMSSYGGYLTTEYTAAADVNTSGNLMYIDFQLANGMTAYSNNGISTDVTVAIESVEDQQGDIFFLQFGDVECDDHRSAAYTGRCQRGRKNQSDRCIVRHSVLQ